MQKKPVSSKINFTRIYLRAQFLLSAYVVYRHTNSTNPKLTGPKNFDQDLTFLSFPLHILSISNK